MPGAHCLGQPALEIEPECSVGIEHVEHAALGEGAHRGHPARFHLFRARRLFERCLDADLDFVAAPQPGWRLPLSVAFEWVKLARAELQREC